MKMSKKIASAALASLLAVSMTVSAFAADSVSGNSVQKGADVIADGNGVAVEAKASGKVTKVDVKDGAATVKAVEKKAKKVTLDKVTVNGKTAEVTVVAKNAFKGSKATKVVVKSSKISIKKNAFKGSKKKITLDLTAIKNGKNIKLSKSLGLKKGSTIVVSKKAYKNKALKAILKALKKKGIKIKKK